MQAKKHLFLLKLHKIHNTTTVTTMSHNNAIGFKWKYIGKHWKENYLAFTKFQTYIISTYSTQ